MMSMVKYEKEKDDDKKWEIKFNQKSKTRKISKEIYKAEHISLDFSKMFAV